MGNRAIAQTTSNPAERTGQSLLHRLIGNNPSQMLRGKAAVVPDRAEWDRLGHRQGLGS